FIRWDGDVSGSDRPLTVTVNADMTVDAIFTVDTLRLAVRAEGKGVVTKNADLDGYPFGSKVLVTATPDPGWHFVAWHRYSESMPVDDRPSQRDPISNPCQDCNMGLMNPLALTMDDDQTITAVFEA